MATQAEVTVLVEAARRHRQGAADELTALLYAELRRMARGLMRRERPGSMLQATELVHEAYLRLLGGGAQWQSRAHFLGAASRAMRRILVERARRRRRLKRGGERERVTLTDGKLRVEADPEDLLGLDAALERLGELDPEMARVVELRYFGGLTAEEAAEVLRSSVRSVHRHWAAARAWLHRALSVPPPASA